MTTKVGKTFKDSKTNTIENSLDLILIELYEQSEVNRLERLSAEERERIRELERERERLFTERKNDEIEATIEHKNCALDYDTACKIRAFIEVVKSNEVKSEEQIEWIEWASKKAEWYDPTVAYEDEYLGIRDHDKDEEYKQLKKSYKYW